MLSFSSSNIITICHISISGSKFENFERQMAQLLTLFFFWIQIFRLKKMRHYWIWSVWLRSWMRAMQLKSEARFLNWTNKLEIEEIDEERERERRTRKKETRIEIYDRLVVWEKLTAGSTPIFMFFLSFSLFFPRYVIRVTDNSESAPINISALQARNKDNTKLLSQ